MFFGIADDENYEFSKLVQAQASPTTSTFTSTSTAQATATYNTRTTSAVYQHIACYHRTHLIIPIPPPPGSIPSF